MRARIVAAFSLISLVVTAASAVGGETPRGPGQDERRTGSSVQEPGGSASLEPGIPRVSPGSVILLGDCSGNPVWGEGAGFAPAGRTLRLPAGITTVVVPPPSAGGSPSPLFLLRAGDGTLMARGEDGLLGVLAEELGDPVSAAREWSAAEGAGDLFIADARGRRILRIAPDGSVVAVQDEGSLPAGPAQLLFERKPGGETGWLWVVAGDQVLRTGTALRIVEPVASLPADSAGAVFLRESDGSTGDLLVSTGAQGTILRVPRGGGEISVFARAATPLRGLALEPSSGLVFAATPSGFAVFEPSGALLGQESVETCAGGPSGIAVIPDLGRPSVAGAWSLGRMRVLVRFSEPMRRNAALLDPASYAIDGWPVLAVNPVDETTVVLELSPEPLQGMLPVLAGVAPSGGQPGTPVLDLEELVARALPPVGDLRLSDRLLDLALNPALTLPAPIGPRAPDDCLADPLVDSQPPSPAGDFLSVCLDDAVRPFPAPGDNIVSVPLDGSEGTPATDAGHQICAWNWTLTVPPCPIGFGCIFEQILLVIPIPEDPATPQAVVLFISDPSTIIPLVVTHDIVDRTDCADPGSPTCADSETLFIFLEPNPDVTDVTQDDGGNRVFCPGEPITFTPVATTFVTPPNATWSWDFGDGIGTSTDPAPVYAYSAPGVYTVNVTVEERINIPFYGDLTSCGDTFQFTVTVVDPPVASAGGPYEACAGDSLLLDGTGTAAAGGGLTFSWSTSIPFATFDDPALEDPTITIPGGAVSGDLFFTVTESGTECASTSTVPLTVNALPTASAGGPYTVCDGGSIPLNATLAPGAGGTFTILWSTDIPGATFDDPTTEDPILTVPPGASSGTLSVSVIESPSGCAQSASVAVTVVAPPAVTLPLSFEVCEGGSVALTATGTPGAGGTLAWQWSSDIPGASFLPSASDPAPILSVPFGAASGTVTVTVTESPSGCVSAPASAPVTVNAAPDLAPPPATFEVCEGETVTLGVIATPGQGGTVGSYSWTTDIPGATFSPSANDPAPTLSVPAGASSGTVTVSVVESPSGCAASLTMGVTVHSLPAVSAGGPYSACESGAVSLDATASASAGGTLSFQWTTDIPGASIDDPLAEDPVLTLPAGGAPGTVTVTVTETPSGCVAFASAAVSVFGPPVLGGASSLALCEGSSTAVDLTVGTSQPGSTLVFAWTTDIPGATFDDAAIEDPTLTVPGGAPDGTVTVNVVENPLGCVAVRTIPVDVVQRPVVDAGGPYAACEGRQVPLDGTATGAGGFAFGWTADVPGAAFTPSPSVEDPVLDLAGAGGFTGTLTLTLAVVETGSGLSCSASDTAPVDVRPAPSVDFTSTAPQCAGDTVAFDAVIAGGTAPFAYTWDWGDGGSEGGSTGAATLSASHAFAAGGVFSVTITVTDSLGCSATVTHPVAVNALPVPGFTATTPVCLGDATTFTNTTTGAVAYQWDFGDGGVSVQASPSHVYAAAGTWTVTLTATSLDGCTATTSAEVEVRSNPDLTLFTDSPRCPGDPVRFVAQVRGGTGPFTILWDFGDGGTGTGAQVSHAYGAPGSFLARASVVDALGCEGTATVPVSILDVDLFAVGAAFTDAAFNGNGNGAIDPGETIPIAVYVYNAGTDTATGVQVTVEAIGDYGTITVFQDTASVPDLPPGGLDVTRSPGLIVQFSPDYACGQTIALRFTLTALGGGCARSFSFYTNLGSFSPGVLEPPRRATVCGGLSLGTSLTWSGEQWGIGFADGREDNRTKQEAYVTFLTEEGWRILENHRLTFADGQVRDVRATWNGDLGEYGVAWSDAREADSSGERGIWFARVDTLGNLLAPEKKITAPGSRATQPVVEWTGTHYAIAWTDGSSPGDPEIGFAAISTGGAFLSGPRRITASDGDSSEPAMAWDGEVLALAWSDGRFATPHVLFQLLDALGNPLGAVVDLTPVTGGAHAPDLAVDSTGYGVVWSENFGGQQDIRFARLDLLGDVVSGPVTLSATAGGSDWPTIAWSGWNYGVAWQEDADGLLHDIWFAGVSLTGNLVGTPVRINESRRDSLRPDLAWNPESGYYGLAYQDDVGDPGESEIWFQRIWAAATSQCSPVSPIPDPTPAEVRNLRVRREGTDLVVTFDPADGAEGYRVYTGDLGRLRALGYDHRVAEGAGLGRCSSPVTEFRDRDDLEDGRTAYYLATALGSEGIEGPAGWAQRLLPAGGAAEIPAGPVEGCP